MASKKHIISIVIIIILVSLVSSNKKESYVQNWCYQESATTSTSCGGVGTGSYSVAPNYFYINYTKPAAATTLKWQIKAGGNSGVGYPNFLYNITATGCENNPTSCTPFPAGCINRPVISLRWYSKGSVTLQGHPECYDGSNWVSIGINSVSSANLQGGCGGGILQSTDLYDTNWNTGAEYVEAISAWCNDVSYFACNRLSEEAVYWDIPTTVYVYSDFSNYHSNYRAGSYPWSTFSTNSNGWVNS